MRASRPRLRRPPRRGPAALWATLAAAAALGCTAIQHGLEAGDLAGEPLPTRSARGAERLGAETKVDPSVRAYVSEHGRPDYLYVESRQELYLLYLEADRAAKFERVLIEASRVEELGRIPGRLLERLPAGVQQQLRARRAAAQRRAQDEARRSLAAQSRRGPVRPPAARAPAGLYLGAFEAASLVQRMREPLTAADPGVAGWRSSRQRDGGVAWSASAGRTRYWVAEQRVAFTTPISASRAQLPGAARIAIQRVNNAVFAGRADAVNAVALELAERAASDRTGRTQFRRRVAGRTLHVGRLAGRGVFSYSVHP